MMVSDFIVVGAAGHLGSEIYKSLRTANSSVSGVDKVGCDETESDIECCDFSSPSAVREYFRTETVPLVGDQLVLVLAQGKIHSEPVLRMEGTEYKTHDEDKWDEIIESNLKTSFVGATEFAMHCRIRRKRGLIIAFSSISARGASGQIAYSSAKAGIEAMVRTLAQELGPTGIRAVAIAPGYIDVASTRHNLSDLRLENIKRRTPLRRLGRSGEIVSTIMWLAETEYVNGTVVALDGGLVV